MYLKGIPHLSVFLKHSLIKQSSQMQHKSPWEFVKM